MSNNPNNQKGATMQEMPLSAYTDDPVYNMKAVTQRTGIPAATLRAWERRYHALVPSRTDGNYRLYSERDIATLSWLKHQLDAGLSISRAVGLLERLHDHENREGVEVDQAATLDQASIDTARAAHAASAIANWDRLITALSSALLALDEQQAGLVMAEAFALYTVEDVCLYLVTPVMVLIGDGWFKGDVSVVQEHFASSYLSGRLMSLFNAQRSERGALILVGCAPGERHELGALMLALMLRRAGHKVCYLGADIPLADLVQAIRELRPQVVAISAMLGEAVTRLEELPRLLAAANLKTHLVFGGQAFTAAESLNDHIPVDYTGADLGQGLEVIEHLLAVDVPRNAPVQGTQAGMVASWANR